MAKISFVARSFIQARLLDAESGFNYWIQQAAPDYNLTAFQLVQGSNVFLGPITADLIEQTGDCTYPLCIVSSAKTINQNVVSPNEFGGVTITIVDFYNSFADSKPPSDPESPADAIEDSMYECFNRADYYGISTDPALTYNNEMDSVRFPLLFGGSNWRQQLRFTLTHRYITAGR